MARSVDDGSKSAASNLAQQLGSSLNAPGTSGVFRTVLTLLAEGKPVPRRAKVLPGAPRSAVVDMTTGMASLTVSAHAPGHASASRSPLTSRSVMLPEPVPTSTLPLMPSTF